LKENARKGNNDEDRKRHNKIKIEPLTKHEIM